MAAPEAAGLHLGQQVVDRGILDRRGRHAGTVADLVLEVHTPSSDGSPSAPLVTALLTGPMAVAQDLPRPLAWLARAIYRVLGLADPRPVEIAWTHVAELDVVVHLDVARAEVGFERLPDAVTRRFIGRLPGA